MFPALVMNAWLDENIWTYTFLDKKKIMTLQHIQYANL